MFNRPQSRPSHPYAEDSPLHNRRLMAPAVTVLAILVVLAIMLLIVMWVR